MGVGARFLCASFLAVTAAPESVGEVDALYYLQPRRGRIVLRNKHCLGITLNSVQS